MMRVHLRVLRCGMKVDNLKLREIVSLCPLVIV